jgi:hypothetical protein
MPILSGPVEPVDDRAAVILVRGMLAITVLLRDASAKRDIELGMIVLAIYLGWLEKKPFDVSGLSSTTGIPRATVTRKLREWPRIKWERVGRRIVPRITLSPAKDTLLQAVRTVCRNCASELQKAENP